MVYVFVRVTLATELQGYVGSSRSTLLHRFHVLALPLSHLSPIKILPIPYTRHTRLSRFCRLIKSRELVPLLKVFISMYQTFFRVRFRAACVPNLRKLNKFLFFWRALLYSCLLHFWLIDLLRLRYWQWFLFGLLNNYSECRGTQTGKLVYFWAGH